MKFKKLTGYPEFELQAYVKKYLEDHKEYDVKIYLGCDSQTKADQTIYATTVVFHVASTGCHVIYKKEKSTCYQRHVDQTMERSRKISRGRSVPKRIWNRN
jgi:predicted RNase H-related nuclease YkuK (DUF458 family)